MTKEQIKERIEKEIKRMKEETESRGREWYGAGLPICGGECDECQHRAEMWAERIGCTVEELWDAIY